MLPEIQTFRPATLAEAFELLAQHGSGIKPLAGGTNIVVELRNRHVPAATLMDLHALHGLRGVAIGEGQVVVGAGTTISYLLADPTIARHGVPLHQAAGRFANPLVRNRATIGGNIVDASPAADTLPPLLALGAEVELGSRNGSRRLPLDEFLIGVNQTLRRDDELLLSVRWPIPAARSGGSFSKIGLRRGASCSVISAAVQLAFDPAGRVSLCRIALGAVAARAIRCRQAETMLIGTTMTHELVAKAGAMAAAAARPIDDIRGSAAYRQRMAEVLVCRQLRSVASECLGSTQ